jgi:hypothetical protein
MATIFMINKEIARGMVCFFHQKKHSYLIFVGRKMTIAKWRFSQKTIFDEEEVWEEEWEFL